MYRTNPEIPKQLPNRNCTRRSGVEAESNLPGYAEGGAGGSSERPAEMRG